MTPVMHKTAVVLLLAGASVAQPPNTLHAQASMALLLEIRDAIGPATSDFFVRTLEQARERQAPIVIVQMDTPGGLDSSMRDMIKAILASPVPVAVYVSPSVPARRAPAPTYSTRATLRRWRRQRTWVRPLQYRSAGQPRALHA